MSTAERLAEALDSVIKAWDELHGSTTYVPGIGDRQEDLEFREMQRARAALAAYRSTPADGGGQVGTPASTGGERKEPPLNGRCQADRDGDCVHSQCPQLRDGEPKATGRHCPLDTEDDDA